MTPLDHIALELGRRVALGHLYESSNAISARFAGRCATGDCGHGAFGVGQFCYLHLITLGSAN